jgi:hypothetical protein
VHEIEIATADAQRGLWAARSKLRRRRTSAKAESLSATETGDGGATIEAAEPANRER